MSDTHGEFSVIEVFIGVALLALIAAGVISSAGELADAAGNVTNTQTEAMNQFGNQQNNTQNNTQTNTNNVAAGNFNGAGNTNNAWNSVPTVNVNNSFSTVTVVGYVDTFYQTASGA